MMVQPKYKKRGWFGESHRHYLAAKGISTKYNYKRYFYHTGKNEDDEHDFTDKLEVDDSHMSIYQEHGFENRRDYLNNLATEHGVDPEVVYALARLLGKNEDFDGLVNSVEDAAREGFGDSEYFFKKLNRPTPKMFRVVDVEKDGQLTEFSFLQDAIKHAEGNKYKHIIMPDGSVKWLGDSVDGEGFTSRPVYTQLKFGAHKWPDKTPQDDPKYTLTWTEDGQKRVAEFNKKEDALELGQEMKDQGMTSSFTVKPVSPDGRYSVVAKQDMKTHWKYDLLDGMTGEVHAKTLEKPTRSVEMNPARLVNDILDNNAERAKKPRERPTTKRVHSFGDAYERPLDYVGDMIK